MRPDLDVVHLTCGAENLIIAGQLGIISSIWQMRCRCTYAM